MGGKDRVTTPNYYREVLTFCISGSCFKRIKSLKWEDIDPYVHIAIPGGAFYIHQYVLPPKVSGTVETIDIDTVINILQTSNAVNFSTGVKNEQTAAATIRRTDKLTATFTFYNFRVETIGLKEASENPKDEPIYFIKFIASTVVKS